MGQFTHNGVVYEELPNGKVRPIAYANPMAGATPVGGPDPMKPLQIQGAQLGNQKDAIAIQNAPAQQQGQVLSNQGQEISNALKPREFETDKTAQLRGEFGRHPAVTKYQDAVPAMADALTAPDTAAGDQSIVYAFGKVMDPGSSVREGEQRSAGLTGSLLGRFQSYLGMVNSGQRIPADGRRWLQDAMRHRVASLNRAYTQVRHRYQTLAKKQGFDPEMVVGPHEGEPFQAQESQFLGRPVRNGPKSATPVEFDSIISGMIEQQKPVAEIRQTLKDYGSSVPPWQEKILDQYEAARLAGKTPQIQVRTLPGQDEISGLAKGFKGAWDRAAVGAQEAFNAIPFLPDSNSASRAQQDTRDYFSGVQASPGAETLGRLAGATLFSAPIRNPFAAGAAGNLLMTDSTGIEAAKDAAVGAVGGKVADLALRGAAGLAAPQGREAMKRLATEGVRFSPGQMIGGRARAIEDRLTANPVLGPKIDAIREQGLEAANRIPANRALAPIGQSLPPNVPAGHEAVAYTQNALGNAYDNALAGRQIALDPTFITRLNTIGQRSNMRPDEFGKAADIFQREVGGAFQEPGTPLGSMSGRMFKKLDSRLGKLAADFRRSPNVFDRDIGDLLGQVKDQTRALARRQSPEMGDALRAADEGYANFKIFERAAASNPATGIFTPGQLRTAIKAGDRSVGKGATARGEARMQDLASDMSEALPSTVGSSGTSEREQVNKMAPWVLGSLMSPLYSETAEQIIARTLLRDPGPAAQAVANRLRALPRGMFGGLIPLGINPGQGY